jgi:hypothetical protein
MRHAQLVWPDMVRDDPNAPALLARAESRIVAAEIALRGLFGGAK